MKTDNYEKIVLRKGTKLDVFCPMCKERMKFWRLIIRKHPGMKDDPAGRFVCQTTFCPITDIEIRLNWNCHWHEEG